MSKKFLILITALSITTACNPSQEKIAQELENKVKTTINDLSNNPSQPIEEVKKLSQLEYKTLVFPLEVDPSKITEELNILGQERWDCPTGFSRPRTSPKPPEIVIICKRTPETVLRFVPKGLFGR